MRRCDVSVILSTYNRADLLGGAVDRLLAQVTSTAAYEVVIVDNNSTDGTREVVEGRLAAAGGRLRYVFEPQQGLSFGRNAGLANVSADIVAFTDDDVRVCDGWVQSIKDTFDVRQDLDAVGGRILPEWQVPPPAWLTRRHWVGPLALQDYGDTPLIVDAAGPRCLAGANLAFRKHVFDKIGRFSHEFGSCAEDTELMVRFWRAGYRAMYVPDLVVHAPVQIERLTKAYHRRWHVRCGSYARLAEERGAAMGRGASASPTARILGVPRTAFRELASETLCWLRDAARQRDGDAFWHEGQVREILAYMRESRALHRRLSREAPVRQPRDGAERQPADCGCRQGGAS